MQKFGNIKWNYFFEFVSILALLISYFLIVYQSFLNYHFINNNKSKDIIAERILYERLYEEINSNIQSYSFTEIKKLMSQELII